jgi:hypothetical protein
MGGKLERIWKKVAMAKIEVLFCQLFREAEEDDRTPQSG